MRSCVCGMTAVAAVLWGAVGWSADRVTALSLASEDSNAFTDDAGYSEWPGLMAWGCEPVWRARANALYMRLSRPNDAMLVTDNFGHGVGGPRDAVLLNAAEFAFRYEPGWEVSLLRQLDADWGIEGLYFRVDAWNASREPVSAPNGSTVQYAVPIGNVTFPGTIAGSYRSELSNVEINGRRRLNDCWSALAGFRYLALNETGLAILQDVGPGANLATHDVRAVNDLFGFQLGMDANLWSCGPLRIEGLLKAGIYADRAANSVSVSQQIGPPFGSNASADHPAFVGEIDLTGVYRMSKNWSLRGGYRVLWVEGVAQASDQVAVSNPVAAAASVSFKGSPFYDGAFLGLEFAH